MTPISGYMTIGNKRKRRGNIHTDPDCGYLMRGVYVAGMDKEIVHVVADSSYTIKKCPHCYGPPTTAQLVSRLLAARRKGEQ